MRSARPSTADPATRRSGDYGSIPDPGQSYLPSHPDSYAELSVLDRNPANGGTFTFADAERARPAALHDGAARLAATDAAMLLYKRDIGYGQGPGQKIENGQPYRLDLWWQAAQALGVTKSAVQVAARAAHRGRATLGALPATAERWLGEASGELSGGGRRGSIPLPLTPGTQTTILASGLAAAGEEAPAR